MSGMRRKFSFVVLGAFLAVTGTYIFIYLFRSFRSQGASGRELVEIWHGDNFTRTILVAVLFLIGEVFAVYLALSRERRSGVVSVRGDLWAWLSARSDLTGEPEDQIAQRAISMYRYRLEGGPNGLPSIPEDDQPFRASSTRSTR